MAPDTVIEHVRGLTASQCREVVLAGIHLGMYGQDLSVKTDLACLTRRLLDETAMERIRFGSIEPRELSSGLLELASSDARICRHFHVPLQSGDDGVLKRMKRPYDRSFFSERICEVHERMPEAAIGIDVLVGFPGESDDAFGQTQQLIEQLPISHLHVFPYSPRPGTPAARFPDPVPGPVIRERCRVLREIGIRKTRDFAARIIAGKAFPVLFEHTLQTDGRIRGLSDHYLTVFTAGDADLCNRIIPVTGVTVNDTGDVDGSPI